MVITNKSLHWSQRVALVRHNLHAASRSGDFTFFKTLQAQNFLEGSNHAATLSVTLGDDADMLISGLDDLNAGIAQVNEDAFKNVYDSLKCYLRETTSTDGAEARSKVYVDSTMQKQMANMAIDRVTNSAISLIQQQPDYVQDLTANVWICGTTIIADSVEVALEQMRALEHYTADFIRLEESWSIVKSSSSCAIAALRGIYTLMSMDVNGSVIGNSEGANSRRSSIAQAPGNVFRRLSNAFVQNTQTSTVASRTASVSSHLAPGLFNLEYRTPSHLRHSISNACPTSLPDTDNGFRHQLSPILPTPGIFNEDVNPFDVMASPPVPKIPYHAIAPTTVI